MRKRKDRVMFMDMLADASTLRQRNDGARDSICLD
jgi:hypothetical protein